MSAGIYGEEAIKTNLLDIFVSLSVRGEAETNRTLDRIEERAEKTNRALEHLQNNAKQGATFRATAEERGFAGLIKKFAQTRADAARGAEFSVKADTEGFGEARSEVQRTRAQTSKAADFLIRARESGFGQVIGKVVQARARVAKPADFTVRASEQGFAGVNSAISRTSSAADRLDGKNVSLRTTLSGGDQVRSGLEAINLRADRLDGGTVTLSTDLRNGRRVISELQGVDNVSSRIDGDRVTITANVDGTAQGRAALQSLQAAANGVDGDDVRLSASVTGTQSAIGELAALNAAASQVDGRNVRLNVDGSAVGILGRIGQSIADTAQRIRNFQVISSTLSMPGLLAGLGAIPALASAAAAAVGGLASALGQALAGAAGIGGSALAGMAGGFGLVLAAASPTIRALSEHETATNKVKSAQDAARSASEGYADAQRGVADASRGVRDAQRSAAEGVAAAQQQYRDAQRGVAEAERGVIEATKGVAAARREAHEGVRSAQQQYADAQRGVTEAERQLADATRGVADARREANEGVRSAQQQYRDAQRGVADAERQLADAARGVADARREAYQGVQDAIRSYQDAVRGVRDAERELEASRRELGSASVDLWHAQQDLNEAMRDEPRNQAYATLDLADARDRASDATREYNEAVREYGANSEEATDADRRRKRALLDLQAQEQETARIRREGSDELNAAREGVINASEAETEARRGVAESERGLQAARREAAQAYAGIAQAEREGARRVAEAQRGVADAQRGVAEAQRRAHEAARGIEAARIEGARKVADAQRQVADAQRGVQEANRRAAQAAKGIEQARIEGARRVADAQSQVADAQRGVAEAVRRANEAQAGIERARVEGARQVADAQRALIDAQRQLAKAARDNRDAQSELGEALSAVGARLTATQQKLLNAARRFGRAFNAAFRPANDALNMLGARILGVAQRTLPILGRTALKTVNGLDRAFSTLLSQWTAPRQLGLFRQGLAAIPRFTRLGVQSAGQLGTALGNIFIAAIPQARGFLEALNNVTRRFAAWTRSVQGQRALADFFQRSARYARILGASFVDLLIGVKQLFGAFDQAGTTNMMLQGFRNLTREFRNFTAQGTEGRAKIVGFFKAAQPTMRAMWDVVKSLVGEFFRVSNAVLTMRDASGKLVMPAALREMRPALRAIGDLLIASFRNFGPLIGPAIRAIAEFMTIFVANNPVLRGFARAIIGIVQAFNNLDNRFGPVGGALQTLIVSIVSARIAMKALGIGARLLFSPFGRITRALGITGGAAGKAAGPITRLKNAFTSLRNGVRAVGGFLKNVAAQAFKVLSRAVTAVIRPIGRLASFLGPRLMGALRAIGPAFTRIGGVIGRIVPFFARLGGAFARIVPLVARFVPWIARIALIGAVANPIGLVVTAITALATGFIIAYRRSERFRNIVNAIGRFLKGVAISAFRLLGNVVRSVFNFIGNNAPRVWNRLKAVAIPVLRALGRAVKAMWNGIKTAFRVGGRLLVNLWRNPIRTLGRLWNAFWKTVGRVARAGWNLVSRGVRAAWNGIKNVTQRIWNGISNFFSRWWKRLGNLLKRSARGWQRILSGAWNFIKKITSRVWNGISGFFGRWWKRLTNLLKRSANGWQRLIIGAWNAIKNVTSRVWNAISGFFQRFWRGLRRLWDSALRAIGNRTDSWASALRKLFTTLGRWVTRLWNGFWRGLRRLWDSALRAIGNRTQSWRDYLRSLFDRFAKWVRSRWDAFWSGLRGLWDRALRAIGNRTEAWRDALRNLFDRIAKWARSRWNSFWSGLRGLWDRSLRAIGDRLRSWGEATRRLFGNMVDAAKRFGNNLRDALVSRIKSAVNRVRSWLGGLAIALGNVLKALGMDSAAESMKERGNRLKEPLKMAKGGVITHEVVHAYAKGGVSPRALAIGDKGGVGSGKRIVAITNEAGPEGVVPLNKTTPGGMEAMRAAAPRYGFRQVSGARGAAPRTPVHDHIPAYQGGGITGGLGGDVNRRGEQKREKGIPSSYRIPRGTNPWGGTSNSSVGVGKTTWNWSPQVESWIREITYHAGKGTAANTYKGHPGGEQNSVDWWGPRGRGQQIPMSAGDRILAYIKKNIPFKYTLWRGKYDSGKPGPDHFNHLHATLGKGGGGFSGVMDALGNIYNSVKDFIAQKFKPPEIPTLNLGTFGKGLTGGLREMILGGATDWITKQAREHLSIGTGGGGGTVAAFQGDWASDPGGSPAKNKTLGRAAANEAGWKGQWDALHELWMRESGWDKSAKNPTSSATGIPQRMLSSHPLGPNEGDWKTHAGKQIGWGINYIKGRHTDPRGAIAHHDRMGWYKRGGVVPGPIGRAQQAIVHGGERILSAPLARGFEVLARALDRFSALGRGSALERVAQALTRALGGTRGLRATQPARTRQHRTPQRSLSQRIRAWNDVPDAQRFRRGVPEDLEREARAAGYSLAEDLTFVRSGFYGRTDTRPTVKPRANRLPVNSSQVARNIQINASMSTERLEKEIAGLRADTRELIQREIQEIRASAERTGVAIKNSTDSNLANDKDTISSAAKGRARRELKSKLSGRRIN